MCSSAGQNPSTRGIFISKRRPFGPLQLCRHVSIRRIQDGALRMLTERVILHAGRDVAFDEARELPGTHELISQKLFGHCLLLSLPLLDRALWAQLLGASCSPRAARRSAMRSSF